jgi:hypothetical protein
VGFGKERARRAERQYSGGGESGLHRRDQQLIRFGIGPHPVTSDRGMGNLPYDETRIDRCRLAWAKG